MRLWFVLFLCHLVSLAAGQKKEINDFFTNLDGSTWECEGHWKVGKPFHQIYVFKWSENHVVFQTETYDFERSENEKASLRNFGTRMYDRSKQQWRFWEFDYMGGVTEGNISYNNGSIYYTYPYDVNGVVNYMTDAWEFVNDSTYQFKIGVWSDLKWSDVYCEGVIRRK